MLSLLLLDVFRIDSLPISIITLILSFFYLFIIFKLRGQVERREENIYSRSEHAIEPYVVELGLLVFILCVIDVGAPILFQLLLGRSNVEFLLPVYILLPVATFIFDWRELAYSFKETIIAYKHHLRLILDERLPQLFRVPSSKRNVQSLAIVFSIISILPISLSILYLIDVADIIIYLFIAVMQHFLILTVLSGWIISSLRGIEYQLKHHNRSRKFQPLAQTFYLFASNSRDYNGQLILNTVSFPHESILHFQYRGKWVDDSLIYDNSDEDYPIFQNQAMLESYIGSRVVVVAANAIPVSKTNSESNEKKFHQYRFYPLRLGILQQIVSDGPILHLYFSLGDFVDWSDEKVSKLYHDSICQSIGSTNSSRVQTYPLRVSDQVLGKFCCVVPEDKLEGIQVALRDESDKAWHEVIKTIVKLYRDDGNTHDNTAFCRIANVVQLIPLFGIHQTARAIYGFLLGANLPMHRQRVIKQDRLMPTESGYKLKSYGTYLIQLSFFYPKEESKKQELPKSLRHYRINPKYDENIFAVLPEDKKINFRYDQYYLQLNTPNVHFDTQTRLRIEITLTKEQKKLLQEKEPAEIHFADLEILLRISFPRFRNTIAFALLFIAQILIVSAGSDQTLRNLGISGELAENISDIGPIAGPILTTVTLFFLFRRLPSS